MIRILSIVALCLYGHFCDRRPGTFNLLSDSSGGIRTMSSFGVYDIGDYDDTIDDLRVNQADNDLNYGVSSGQSVRFYSSGGSSYSGYVIEVSSIETIDDMDNYVNTLSRLNNIIYSDFEDDLISSDNTINTNGEYRSGLTRFNSGNGGVLNSVYTGCVGVGTPHIILIDQKVFVPNSKSVDDFSNDKIYDNKSKGSSTNNERVHHDESDIETVIALAFGRSIDSKLLVLLRNSQISIPRTSTKMVEVQNGMIIPYPLPNTFW